MVEYLLKFDVLESKRRKGQRKRLGKGIREKVIKDKEVERILRYLLQLNRSRTMLKRVRMRSMVFDDPNLETRRYSQVNQVR